MDRDKKAALANALELLRKVRSDEETRFTKEDWQMLQVARFLVSKEKFIKRDADNITLYYAANKTFYFLDDLSDAVYTLAKYIYDNDPGLIIDTTKKVEYGLPLDPKYSRLTNPTMDEAIIIINMVRNAIAHGNAIIDFENSLLKIDNTMPSETDPNIIKFHMNVDIPISLLSKLDLANIVKKNRPKLEKQVMSAIANKDYIMQDDKVYLLLDYHGFEMRMGLSTKQFMDLSAGAFAFAE